MDFCEISLVTTLGFILEIKLSMNLLWLLIQIGNLPSEKILYQFIFSHTV